jgi:hypothetical protein
MSPGFKDPTTEMPTPPSDYIPLGGVVRFEGPNLSEWVSQIGPHEIPAVSYFVFGTNKGLPN